MLGFLTPLLLAASALAAPTARDESCVDRSQQVTKWKVIKFDFHSSYIFTTPAHQNSWGYVNFTLENPAVDYKPVCSAQSSRLNDFFYGDELYDCELPEGASGGVAQFTYARPSGVLHLNQSWSCADEGAWFQAKGGVDLDLNCHETEWQNPDWKQGEMYSTRNIDCNYVDAEAPIEEISGVRRKA